MKESIRLFGVEQTACGHKKEREKMKRKDQRSCRRFAFIGGLSAMLFVAGWTAPELAAAQNNTAPERPSAGREDRSELDFKFPLRGISDNRLVLSKKIVSGVSFQWVKQKLMAELKEKNPNRTDAEIHDAITKACSEYSKAYDGFLIKGNATFIFSCGETFNEKNMAKSVLVCRKIEMPTAVSFKAAVDRIVKKNPGVTVGKRKKVFLGKMRSGPQTVVEIYEYSVEIQNANQKWIVVQKQRDITNFVSDEKRIDPQNVIIIITDKKLESAFIKMKQDAIRRKRMEKLKKQQDAQTRALEQI